MNDPERQLLANIERDEQWLARYPTVLPDQPMLERVKFQVRLTSWQMESDAMVGPVTTALERAKTAVHRELSLASDFVDKATRSEKLTRVRVADDRDRRQMSDSPGSPAANKVEARREVVGDLHDIERRRRV